MMTKQWVGGCAENVDIFYCSYASSSIFARLLANKQ